VGAAGKCATMAVLAKQSRCACTGFLSTSRGLDVEETDG
jgi:hypothetical protein